VLRIAALAGAALVLEALPGGVVRLAAAAAPATPEPFAPNPWLAIRADGSVTVVVARGEMGQGVRTSLPMIVAEELDCDWSRVEVSTPEPGPRYPRMRTSGSWSVGGGWEPLRHAGAAARDMLVRAAAARWKVAPADCDTANGEVRHASSGRRLAYGALVAAAAALDPPEKPVLKSPERYRLVGTPMKRRDGPAIVTGSARYGIDVRERGMLRASVERGPRLGATVRSFDDAAARRVPGVRNVVAVPSGVAVLAGDSWSAQRGREALRVDWTFPAGEGFDSRAFQRDLVERSREDGWEARAEGDVTAALARAATRLEAVYEYGFQAHAPLEPINAACALDADGGCDLWLGTQAANEVQQAVAKRLGVEPAHVRVHLQLMGGGFGRRLGIDMALEAVEVARAAKAPVQVLWTRPDDLRYGYFQPGSAHRMAGGVDANGKVIAWKHTMAGVPHSAFSEATPSVDLARDLMWGGFDNPYAIPNLRVAHVTLKAPVPTGPWRSVHYPPGVLARECFLDELAFAAKRDPLEVRLELLADTADPNRARLARVLRVAAEKAGWERPAAGRGLGIAANVYDGDTVLAQVAEVSVSGERRVRVHRMVCAVDCGRVINPLGVEGQVESAIVWGLTAALKGEVTFAGGLVEQTGFADYPMLEMGEMPAIEVHVMPGDRPPLGIGEQCVSPVAAAVHNAVFAATGLRVRRSPVPRDL
jgi:isoquinoline 1-oxidoreductase beta subunit